MNKKELIKEYYKTNSVVYWADNRYSREYVAWLERKLLQAINYTHCCEELVCDCELDYSTISKEIDDNKCTNCGLPIIAN